jgi:hypothetical protein
MKSFSRTVIWGSSLNIPGGRCIDRENGDVGVSQLGDHGRERLANFARKAKACIVIMSISSRSSYSAQGNENALTEDSIDDIVGLL